MARLIKGFSWGPLRKRDFKIVVDLFSAPDPENLEYPQ